MKFNEGLEKPEDKEKRWLKEYNKFVTEGNFDAIPIEPINVGDIVAIRENHIIQKVFEIEENTATVGYDLEGKKIRTRVKINDMRSANGFQNAWLSFKGEGDRLRITTEKSADGTWNSRLWDKARDN